MQYIDEVIQEFDWVAVHKTMDALNWKYAGDEETPSVGKLMLRARNLLQAAQDRKQDDYTASSGGFRATAWADGSLRLAFEVAAYETYG